MAGKKNTSAKNIDLTSFKFVLACGKCHPGGGPLETDRDGHRYDEYMKQKGYKPGGDNDLDGDYYKAFWSKTGVLEADCLLCHLPGYNYEERVKQIKEFNFRWAATAGSGIARVIGSVKRGETSEVVYNLKYFDSQGRVKLPIVREIPRDNCLFCHEESDYKKRGASYKARDDVHTRAGLRCVDCHKAGSQAKDKRIAGVEKHEIGKGDDPGDFVKDELDNTVRQCMDCHEKGLQGAPKAVHKELLLRHLEKLACQTCHVPFRSVKAALIQDATVFNPAPGIWPSPKRIWTFYGPDGKPWNYYGELHREGNAFQRVFTFVPERIWYKGKIWPVNRVHSIWVGIIRPKVPGIDMVYMVDYFKMWSAHRSDPKNRFPQLEEIKDDNGDGVPEVNRPTEVKALLSAVKAYLTAEGKLGEQDRLVLVKDDAYTQDGINWTTLDKFPWEATPYASVFKFSHDIYPAKSALGAKGCTDCHSYSSSFFNRPVLVGLWDTKGKLHYEPNYKLLGYSKLSVDAGAFRQEILEPVLYYGFIVVFLILGFFIAFRGFFLNFDSLSRLLASPTGRLAISILFVAIFGPAITVVLGKFISSAGLGYLGLIHKVAGVLAFLLAIYLLLSKGEKGWAFGLGTLLMLYQAVTGGILIFSDSGNLRQIIFTLHDIGALLAVVLAGLVVIFNLFRKRGD
ncbi:cytochrome c3 family protein [Thermosulfidibacter takaii]|uniref:cytochrome c3 family protein n=1 Tax=Thermosulfidibacter takaii TaxID=412593 RepID=UPI0008399C4F|nr:cytochrome c3 family protein [Thermosulfidibacter takaii]